LYLKHFRLHIVFFNQALTDATTHKVEVKKSGPGRLGLGQGGTPRLPPQLYEQLKVKIIRNVIFFCLFSLFCMQMQESCLRINQQCTIGLKDSEVLVSMFDCL
jgi:hypothetical protein